MEKKEKGRKRGVVGSWKKVCSVTRCKGRLFCCVGGLLYDEAHGVILLRSLRCLPHYLFAYLKSETSPSCWNAFRSALFCLAVFHAN